MSLETVIKKKITEMSVATTPVQDRGPLLDMAQRFIIYGPILGRSGEVVKMFKLKVVKRIENIVSVVGTAIKF